MLRFRRGFPRVKLWIFLPFKVFCGIQCWMTFTIPIYLHLYIYTEFYVKYAEHFSSDASHYVYPQHQHVLLTSLRFVVNHSIKQTINLHLSYKKSFIKKGNSFAFLMNNNDNDTEMFHFENL